MKYIQLENSNLVNLEYSLFKEILRTNRAGVYTSTSITGCNTRKYHGLLVCPIDNFGGDSYVLLSSMQCSVIQHDKTFNLGIQQYNDNHFEPKGHKYLYELDIDPTTKMTYRVGGVIISQEFILSKNESQILIKYTLDDAHSPTTLRLKPFLAYRNIHELTHENMQANTRYTEVKNGVKFCLYPQFPELHLQTSKKTDFVAVPDWYKNVEYIKERYRGYGYQEDLFVPGYFEFSINKGESVIISASLNEVSPTGLKTKFANEIKKRTPKTNMKNTLINAAQQFIQRQHDAVMLKAGYHWKKPQMRDMLVALNGLAIFQDDKKVFSSILDTSIPNLKRIYIDEAANNNSSIDIPLWLFYCLNEAEKYLPEIKAAKYYDILKELLTQYRNGIAGKMYLQDDGLIYAKKEGQPMTWMNSTTSYGLLVTPRFGCAVEVNALWYNAITTTLVIAKQKKDKQFIAEWEPMLQKVGESFLKTFCNNQGYLFDYVDGDYCDNSVRPNQVIAAGLKYSPLNKEQKKNILDIATRELLTPRGLRSLSPQSKQYKGAVEGDENQRALTLHQGTAYPWLLSFYADAMVEVHHMSCIGQLKRIIDGFEDEMVEHCIGTISEQYNGTPPFQAKGAISMAWNVAAILKIIYITEQNTL